MDTRGGDGLNYHSNVGHVKYCRVFAMYSETTKETSSAKCLQIATLRGYFGLSVFRLPLRLALAEGRHIT